MRVPLFALLCVWSALPAAADETGQATLEAIGRTLYRTARHPDGTPIAATVQSDIPLPAGTGACASCHRRSGIGTAEGGSRSLNITAPSLFAPTTKPPLRPAYDEATLANALVAGVGADGQMLSELMPRYRLSSDDLRALTAYLRTLGAAPSPGVTDTDLEVATIVAASAPSAEREAIVSVLERYVANKNSGTRREADRADAAARHEYGLSRDRAYRHWNFSVWTLEGPPDTWPAQLARYYADKPPFAVVSGTAGGDFAVVADFCEQAELPCLLPVADAPGNAAERFYTLYYSEGAALDARVTAASIATDFSTSRVLLIYNDDEQGVVGRNAFVAEWQRRGQRTAAAEQRIASRAVPSQREWQRLLAAERPDVVIAWLSSAQLAGLSMTNPGQKPMVYYTAERFTDWSKTPALPDFRERVRHVFPYTLPRADGSQFLREEVWLRANGQGDEAPLPAAQALFAGHVFGEALADMESVFSREFLLETLEHSLDNTYMTTIYPTTTLGPDQRTISRGSYVAHLGPAGAKAFVGAAWIEP